MEWLEIACYGQTLDLKPLDEYKNKSTKCVKRALNDLDYAREELLRSGIHAIIVFNEKHYLEDGRKMYWLDYPWDVMNKDLERNGKDMDAPFVIIVVYCDKGSVDTSRDVLIEYNAASKKFKSYIESLFDSVFGENFRLLKVSKKIYC